MLIFSHGRRLHCRTAYFYTVLRKEDTLQSITKLTFLFYSVYGHQDTDRLCDAPSVF